MERLQSVFAADMLQDMSAGLDRAAAITMAKHDARELMQEPGGHHRAIDFDAILPARIGDSVLDALDCAQQRARCRSFAHDKIVIDRVIMGAGIFVSDENTDHDFYLYLFWIGSVAARDVAIPAPHGQIGCVRAAAEHIQRVAAAQLLVRWVALDIEQRDDVTINVEAKLFAFRPQSAAWRLQ